LLKIEERDKRAAKPITPRRYIGVKETAAQRAREVANGRLAPGAPPRLKKFN
jgi:hypothetical protein